MEKVEYNGGEKYENLLRICMKNSTKPRVMLNNVEGGSAMH